MPLSGADLAIGTMLLLGTPLAVVWLNKQRPKAGWWLLAVIVGFIVIGNAIEELTTGTSPLF